MKLYFFEFARGEIIKKVCEAEEKSKTYQILHGSGRCVRINKSDIGVVDTGWCGGVYLLEDDFEKAKQLFIESKKEEIRVQKKKIEWEKNALCGMEMSLEALENL